MSTLILTKEMMNDGQHIKEHNYEYTDSDKGNDE